MVYFKNGNNQNYLNKKFDDIGNVADKNRNKQK